MPSLAGSSFGGRSTSVAMSANPMLVGLPPSNHEPMNSNLPPSDRSMITDAVTDFASECSVGTRGAFLNQTSVTITGIDHPPGRVPSAVLMNSMRGHLSDQSHLDT